MENLDVGRLSLRSHRALQFGHGSEPWRTIYRRTDGIRGRGFNSATAVSRGDHVTPSRDGPARGFNSATAVSRGDLGVKVADPFVLEASIRPRL